MIAKAIKPKTCKACGTKFTPHRALMAARVCSPMCGMDLARAQREKAAEAERTQERRADAVKREKMKTRGQWQNEAQAAMNAWVRARDAGKPCICCGRYPNSDIGAGGTWDAGHYRSRGSAPHLRFDERNVHAQLKQCNRYDSGNVVGYRMGLIQRIGLELVEALECDQTPRNHTIDELKAIKADYTARARELKRVQA